MREDRPVANRAEQLMEDSSEYDIAVTCEHERASCPDDLLRDAVVATLRRHHAPGAKISVGLVDDHRIATLNETHLGHRGSTDVLSFDLRDREETDDKAGVGNDPPIDGEVVVSYDTAKREAHERGHSVDAELALYVVHGVLHLLGYDDGSKADADRMHETEDAILESLGLGSVYRGTAP